MKGFILTIIASLLLQQPAGRDPLSLEECIAIARSHDRVLRQKEISLSESSRKAALAILDWIPEINVGAGNDFNWGRSVDMQELLIVDNRMTATASFSASATLSLTKGVLNSIRRRSDELEHRSAAIALEEAGIELAAGVTAAFFQVLLCEEACGICRRNCAEIDARSVRAAAEAGAGEKSAADYYELEAQASRERSALEESLNKLKLARMALCDYLDLPPEEEPELLPPTGDSLPPPPSALPYLQSGEHETPALALARTSLEQSRLQLRMAQAAFLPTLAIAGGCGTYYSNSATDRFWNQLSGNINPSAGISLSIPVTGGSESARRVAGARAQLSREELELERRGRAERAAIREAVAEAENLYGICISAETTLSYSARAEAEAMELHRAGEITGAGYLTARNGRLRAEAELVSARYRYLLQLKLLELRYRIKAK